MVHRFVAMLSATNTNNILMSLSVHIHVYYIKCVTGTGPSCRSEVCGGCCTDDSRGGNWKQDCGREEYSTSASCREHTQYIACQQQAWCQLSGTDK